MALLDPDQKRVRSDSEAELDLQRGRAQWRP